MTLEPWKPNHFLFDYVVVFIVVTIPVFSIRWIVQLDQVTKIPTSKTWFIVIIIATLWTVIGRWIQNWRAKRNNWVQEAPPPSPAQIQKAKEEQERPLDEYIVLSAKRAAKHTIWLIELEAKRTEEIEALKKELLELQNTHYVSTDLVEEDVQ